MLDGTFWDLFPEGNDRNNKANVAENGWGKILYTTWEVGFGFGPELFFLSSCVLAFVTKSICITKVPKYFKIYSDENRDEYREINLKV